MKNSKKNVRVAHGIGRGERLEDLMGHGSYFPGRRAPPLFPCIAPLGLLYGTVMVFRCQLTQLVCWPIGPDGVDRMITLCR